MSENGVPPNCNFNKQTQVFSGQLGSQTGPPFFTDSPSNQLASFWRWFGFKNSSKAALSNRAVDSLGNINLSNITQNGSKLEGL